MLIAFSVDSPATSASQVVLNFIKGVKCADGAHCLPQGAGVPRGAPAFFMARA